MLASLSAAKAKAILSYPDLDKDFVLETDASALGLGAVLSELRMRVHPVAYASRSLSPQEKRYAVTELETLAVVWAVSHFHAYLYGHNVQVFTDHSAVKAVRKLPAPVASTLGDGPRCVKNIQVTYQAGRENSNADALSRCPLQRETPTTSVTDVAVAQVQCADSDIGDLLQQLSVTDIPASMHYSQEQAKDSEILQFETVSVSWGATRLP